MQELHLSLNSKLHTSNLNYKVQKIVDINNKVVAGELLVDFSRAESNLELQTYLNAINLGIITQFSLDFAFNNITNTTNLNKFSTLFFNLERNNLCDVRILSQILELNLVCSLNGLELVVEITERDKCGKCCNVIKGLTFLKERGIKLALDDYDYVFGDFRYNELKLGYYDYVKVDMSKNQLELDLLRNFVFENNKYFKKGIIVERIEASDELYKNLPHQYIYGYQGFFFCKGISI